jgi:hypothetical protein
VTERSTPDVDVALRALATTLEIPAPPDYAARVLVRLDEGTRSDRRLRLVRVPKLLVAAAAVLLGTALTVAVPASRHELASWFGFSGIDIRVEPSSSSSLPPTPAPLAAGQRITLERARIVTAGRLTLPDGSAPDQIFLRRDHSATVITLAFRHADGLRPTPDTGFALIVTEIFDAGSPLMEKMVHTGAQATEVEVRGHPGVFIVGPQEIITVDRTRTSNGMQVVHEVAARSSANSLIWGDASGTYRLEGDFDRTTALRVAETLR